MKPFALLQHRGKPDNGDRYAAHKQRLRAVLGAAVNHFNATDRPVTLPRLAWVERMDAKYGAPR
jgi:hypothetical protein